MNGYTITMICVLAVHLIFIIVRAVTAYVKANEDGIIRVVPSSIAGIILSAAAIVFFVFAVSYFTDQSKPYKEFLDDLNTRGTAPLAEYYGIAPEELGSGMPEEQKPLLLSNAKIYCERAIKDYTGKRTIAVLCAVECAAIALTCGAFITRNGKVYFTSKGLFNDDTSCEFFACVKGKRIRFYNKDDSRKLPFSLPATGENLMLCDNFIRPEVLDSTEPAKQN